MLTKYVSLNDSQVWNLKPANGKNPVAQDHNPVFSPEKTVLPKCLSCSLLFVQDGKQPGTK